MRSGKGVGAWTIALALVAGARRADGGEAASRMANVHIGQRATAEAVERVLKDASLRMASPRCRRVLEGFRDAEGRSLAENLDALGVDVEAYLGRVIFYDGHLERRCEAKTTLAFTHVGSRVVWVCPEQFRNAAFRSPRTAEATLIHEALHTLGLGEDPPASREITARVVAECRR